MTAFAQPLRLAGKLALTVSLIALTAAAINTKGDSQIQDPRSIALESWHGYLEQIGWPQDMAERIAPRFLGTLSQDVANDHGGQTVTFDGSRPGLLATVTVVLDAAGKSVGEPVVELADVVEAR